MAELKREDVQPAIVGRLLAFRAFTAEGVTALEQTFPGGSWSDDADGKPVYVTRLRVRNA